MRIRLSDPTLSSDLLRFLQKRPDVIGDQIGEDELEVSLLGSWRQPYDRLELDLRLRAWRVAHRAVDVQIVE